MPARLLGQQVHALLAGCEHGGDAGTGTRGKGNSLAQAGKSEKPTLAGRLRTLKRGPKSSPGTGNKGRALLRHE
eukprot:1159783-Pelagomonas_calceolata.AAC.4